MNKQIEALKLALEAAYLAGFNASSEVFNGENPFRKNGKTPIESNRWFRSRNEYIREALAEQPAQQAQQAAIKTLEALGYTYHGAELWKPPLGKPAQQQKPSDRFKDFPINGRGEPIIYDTNKIDEIALLLTGDEGEEDSVTVLHKLVRYLNAVHPGKTMTQVLIETEKAALAAQQWNPNDHYKDGWRDGMLTAQQEPVALDVTIDDEDALAALRDTIVQSDGDLTGIRLLVGNGHSGYGLYVANAEYQEEGALLLANTSPPASKPLTDEQITEHFKENVDTGSLLSFADGVRFAEAAHGIKGDA